MRSLYKSAKAWISFRLERNPEVEKPRLDYRNYIPQPYEGVVIVSADFELAWAWRFDRLNPDPIKNSIELARKERTNIPKLLALSEQYNIPVTWGTVGHLFLDHCIPSGNIHHPEMKRIPFFENTWWKYTDGDWFFHDPASSTKAAPEWYAPDLVRQILDSKVKHEIGCHTFSHISCSDVNCPAEVLEDELKASQQAADPFGIRLESFIFPGHTMGNYNVLRKAGYTSMRSNYINVLGYPNLHRNGLWEHKTTMELGYNKLFPVHHNLKRYRVILEKCMQNRQVCNLWFHPSFGDINIQKILPKVYAMLDANRDKLWITTMKEYTAWLNSRKNENT